MQNNLKEKILCIKLQLLLLQIGMASNNAEEAVMACKQKVSTFLELGDNRRSTLFK